METPAAMQLRYLQSLNTIAGERNSTIIFPIPIDLIGAFINTGRPHVKKETQSAV